MRTKKVASLALLTVLGASCASGDSPTEPSDETTVDDSPGDFPEQLDADRVVSEKAKIDKNVQVFLPFYHDISPPLRDLEPVVLEHEEEHEAEQLRRVPRPDAVSVPSTDRVVQDQPVANSVMPAPIKTWDGVGKGAYGYSVFTAPPDTDGDVGPNHYIQIVNTSYIIFDKAGNKLLGPVTTNTLWKGMGGGCETKNDGDGVVRYDRYANRWVISQFSVNGGNGPFFQCVAVSTTPDPTGTYARYSYPFDAMNDYPKIALWPDGYYISFNMFPNLQFNGSRVCAFDRAKMLTGGAATMQCFNTTKDYGGLMVGDVDGPSLPPAGAPAYVVSLGVSNNDLAFWKLHVDWNAPANSTFAGPSKIDVEQYTALCAGQQSCVPQPPAFFGQKLDGLDDRLMNRVVYRNFGDHDALVLGHAVQRTGGGGGMRWYELRNMAATPTVFQSGTYAPDGSVRWMGSLAFDKMGDIALGFSISSATIKPSIAYTARVAADALGTMGQGEARLQDGGGIQAGFSGVTRWGDYSSLNVDATDDCTFWYTQEYLQANGEFNWNTRIGSFKLPGCTAGGDSTKPVTTITEPAEGAQVSGVTAIKASASDNVSVSRVEFYADSTLVATSTSAPYSASWDTRASGDGSHSLTTRAYDAAGNVGLSSAVSVTVKNGGADTTAPLTSITAPAAGATVSGTVSIKANASDNVGVTRVEFYSGTTLISTSSTVPYSASWNTTLLVNGTYSLKTKAYDAAGNSGTSAAVSVTVSNATSAVELVTNGGFETGTTEGWTTAGRVGATTAHHASGTYSARVGSTKAYNGNSTLTQSVTVPATGTTTLTFRYLLRCEKDTIDQAQQQAFVLDDTGAVLTQIFSFCKYTTSWTGASLDLTPYAGKRVQIHFKTHDDGFVDDPVWFYVDKISAINRK